MASHIYSNEYLEHYAERYRELLLRFHGISLLQYLAAPRACELVAERWARQPDPCPAQILPQQISEAERLLERGLDHCPRRGGAIVEPLHHHRRHKRGPTATFRRAH